jgi:prepilin-type N-terminal cleavage/methylation domain-containing protein
MQMRDRRAGFTLIELMVTVAVVAILASIALPSFFSETRKTKAFSEVQPIFNDLRVRLEQYLQEHGDYPTSLGETTLHPSGPLSPTKRSINPMPPDWVAAKIRISGNDEVYCGYTWVTGPADGGVIGTLASTRFGFTVLPSIAWYYLLAKCEMDGNAATFSYYFTTSLDPEIKKLDEGQ